MNFLPQVADNSLVIVEDDQLFLGRLKRAMEARGFDVSATQSASEGMRIIDSRRPAFAMVDLKLEDGNGLEVVERLKRRRDDARAVVLTGYGNFASAVAAVKSGAVDYLAKPADADDVYAALVDRYDRTTAPEANPLSADRVRWEYIQRVFETCGRNVSETARRLGMHRRTLQRILGKRAPR